ncbi:MAG: VPS10 domain-containing protein [Longimicrobiales bacterium]
MLRSAAWALVSSALITPSILAQTPPTTDQLNGLQARNIGPAAMSGRIVDLAVVNHDPTTFYVATSTGGVFKTTDNGITLSPVFENEATHSVGAVAVHQEDTDQVWVGTGERASRQSSGWGDGVYKSTDGGKSWTNMGLTDSRHIGRIAMHPTNPEVVFVAAMGHLWGPNDERGLYKTTDGGAQWTRVLEIDENTGAVDVALDPGNPDIVYASMYQRRRRAWGFHGGGPGSGLYKSVDGGSSWTELTAQGGNGLPEGELGRIGISIYQSNPEIVYASVEQGFRYNASTAYGERRAGIYRSEDRGESWEFMSDWNPRPMYASQILVDPSDDQRIYMVNAYSFSDDGGRTFTVPRQSLHGDDRLVWVNPQDSRHVMKADDGGLGISYDRGLTWLYISDLPVSQFYHVSVDMAVPYRVYGGLQDNGSWMGPSETDRTAGILNEDWMRLGGGDGFWNVPDTTNNRIVYTESQYLGLSRFDTQTGERTTIRPGDPTGHIGARRNWETWKDLSSEEQRLGNAMAPANWEGPFILSPHDASTLYAGTNILWKSTDRGDSWTELGDLTTGVDRRTLEIMGERPQELTLSLDDGIPYYPTISAVAESPLVIGMLYAGTDDGRFHVSMDDGANWTDVTAAFPGLMSGALVNRIEPSRHVEGRVYAVWNNYRNDDYANYLYVSEDFGSTWTSLAYDLPAERVLRSVREDTRNPNVLFLGAEIGLYWSMDRGSNWTELRGGMPTTAFNDLIIHPRDNDLVLGTHGRGVWIFDQINAFQEISPAVMEADIHVFTMEPATQNRRVVSGAHTGDVYYRGENPPTGALVDYWLRETADSGAVQVVVANRAGEVVATLAGEGRAGLNRVVWDLRHQPPAGSGPGGGGGFFGQSRSPLVVPGNYDITVSAGGASSTQSVRVQEDPRITASPAVRARWTENLLALGALKEEADTELALVRETIEEDGDDASDKLKDLERELAELSGRIRRLSGDISGVVAAPTQDQQSRWAYYAEMVETLQRESAEAR